MEHPSGKIFITNAKVLIKIIFSAHSVMKFTRKTSQNINVAVNIKNLLNLHCIIFKAWIESKAV